MTARPLTLRLAVDADAGTVRRFAELDSARGLRGLLLLAETDGVAVAAISLTTGAVIADPSRHSAEAARLLRLRRAQLLRENGDVAPEPRLRAA
jgi:hypothetical protein